MWLASLILLLSVQDIKGSTFISEPNIIFHTEAFFIPIQRDWFKDFFASDDDVEFSASLMDMPDLPNWMFCRHPNASRNAFLYGAAQEVGTLNIDIIALNRNNYETAQKVMKLNVQPRKGDVATYEVEMKFVNLNVEDMFKGNRLSRLTEVFSDTLWKGNRALYVTKVVSSLDVGGRLPLNPNEKEGVVVRIGGLSEFSRTLQDLEREVQPLRNRFPCPRDYKRTSVEHLFRSKSFVADWCSFRLITNVKDGATGSSREMANPTYSTSLLHDDFKPQSINLPRRDFLFDFIISIIVPSAVVGVLSTALTCVMCCSKDGLIKKLDKESNSVQLNQYDSVHCAATDQNDTADRDGLPCSAYTGGSSVPHSTLGSPNSTLHKSYATRSSSRTGTLRGMLPPPPPYTPPSVASKRSGVAAH